MRVDQHSTLHAVRRLLGRAADGRPPLEALEMSRAGEMLARLGLAGTSAAEAVGERHAAAYRSLLLDAGVDLGAPAGSALVEAERLRTRLGAALPGIPADRRRDLLTWAAALDGAMIADLRASTADLCAARDTAIAASEWPAVTPGRVERLLRDHAPDLASVRVVELSPIGGVSANEAHFVTLADQGSWPDRVVLRRARKVGIQPRPVSDEYHVLRALEGAGIPVPRALLVDDGAALDTACVVVGVLPGSPQSLTTAGDLGRAVTREMADCLARIHSLDPAAVLPADRRAGQRSAEQWVRARVAEFELAWRGCATEPSFIIEHAFDWLRRHAWLVADGAVVVHGDFDQRNVLVDGGRLTGVIDWEVSHEGHPAEDLAYVRPQVEALMPWAEFLERYVAAGGSPVTQEQLCFAEVLADLMRLTTSMKAYATFADAAHGDLFIASVVTLELESVLADVHRLTAREIVPAAT